MVIESLKAVQTALKETMKDKDISEASKKRLAESETALQKLIEEARKAAKAAKAAEAEKEEAAESGEEDEEAEDEMPEAGHTITTTHKVKHDGPMGEEDGGKDEKDAKDEKDGEESEESKESKRGYITSLLKEAGIPEKAWELDKLSKLGLKEAKAEIEAKKSLVEDLRKEVAKDNNEMFKPSDGSPMKESDGGENLNSLFTGCAQ